MIWEVQLLWMVKQVQQGMVLLQRLLVQVLLGQQELELQQERVLKVV